METPDLLENMPRSCGDCEHYEGNPPYKTLGNCSFRSEEALQNAHTDGMPKPLRVEYVMKSTTDATDCREFLWSEESRQSTEAAIHDGYLSPSLCGRMHP